jgi:hypothetical protein
VLSIFEKPNALLRLEGFAVFILALAIYWHQSFSWTLFWSTIWLPDLAFFGYVVNSKVGAVTYNITHSKLLPCALALASVTNGGTLFLSLALIWFVHIGVDRLFGYGLKYPEGFKITHLGVIGQVADASFSRYLPWVK